MSGREKVEFGVLVEFRRDSFYTTSNIDADMTEDMFKAPENKRPAAEHSCEVDAKRLKKNFQDAVAMLLKAAYYSDSDFTSRDINCDSMDSHSCVEDLRTQDNMSPLDNGGSSGESYLSESSSSATSFSTDSSPDKDMNDSGLWLSGRGCRSHSPEFSPQYGPTTLRADRVSEILTPPYDDSWDLITCFCMKPYAGRPMIECSECNTWIHLSCAKIRKTNIPEVYTCQKCRDAKYTTRKSTRVRMENHRFTSI